MYPNKKIPSKQRPIKINMKNIQNLLLGCGC